jgi:hypothetical protein
MKKLIANQQIIFSNSIPTSLNPRGKSAHYKNQLYYTCNSINKNIYLFFLYIEKSGAKFKGQEIYKFLLQMSKRGGEDKEDREELSHN